MTKKEALKAIRRASLVEVYVRVTDHDGHYMKVSKAAAHIVVDAVAEDDDNVDEVNIVVCDDGTVRLG